MKIIIFENEINTVKKAFNRVNQIYFNSEIKYIWKTKSQEFNPTIDLENTDLIFMDLDLSVNSDKDGYNLIEELINLHNFKSIVIITGHDYVQEELKKRNLLTIKVIEKPIFLDDLKKVISKFLT